MGRLATCASGDGMRRRVGAIIDDDGRPSISSRPQGAGDGSRVRPHASSWRRRRPIGPATPRSCERCRGRFAAALPLRALWAPNGYGPRGGGPSARATLASTRKHYQAESSLALLRMPSMAMVAGSVGEQNGASTTLFSIGCRWL